DALADGEALAASEMHSVLVAFDHDIVDDQVFERAYVDDVLRLASVETAKVRDAQVFHIEKGELAVESIDQEITHVDAIDDDLQAVDGDVFVIGLGQRALVEQHVGKRS